MDEPLSISALQHFVYCPRQCALIHQEQTWSDNLSTARGSRLHERADQPTEEERDGVTVRRALQLYSDRLGLAGRADVVEFLPDGTPRPVEYKSGSKKPRLADDVQLCAQALCLEEMLGRPVPRGAVYHIASRRRREVNFTPELREATLNAIAGTRALLASGELPTPPADERCEECSLQDACLPFTVRDFSQALRGYDPFDLSEHEEDTA